MSLKSRLVRIVLAVLLLVLFAGYFAFSTFVFSPTESDFDADLSTLVPRQVDFYVAKADLRADVAPWPRLAEWKRIEATPAWAEFSKHDLEEFDRRYGLNKVYEDLARIPQQIRGYDPLDVFGGNNVSVAGFFKPGRIEDAEWVVLGRASWKGKLAASLLRHPGLLKLDAQGIGAEVEGPIVTLTLPGQQRPIHVTRLRDVVAVGTSLELVRKVHELDDAGGQDSFGLGATYADNIQQAPRSPDRDDFEVYVDWRKLAENLKLSGRFPDPDSQDFLPAFVGRLFQLGSVKSLAGVVGFRGGIQADLRAELSSELITPVQKRLYAQRGFERGEVLQSYARLAQADASVFALIQSGLSDLLREMLAASEPALRTNLEDLLRSTGEFPDALSFINEMGGLFKSRVALVMRPNDYKYDAAKDPPNDGRPIAAWCLVFWMESTDKGRARVDQLHQIVNRNQGRFGIEGLRPGESGVFRNVVAGGFEIWEFWNKFVPGTGHVATVVAGDMYWISNSFKMVDDMIKTYYTGGPGSPRLTDVPEFTTLFNSSPGSGNVVAWLNPRSLGSIRRQFAKRGAEEQVLGKIDWKVERARLEDRFLKEKFPGRRRGELDEGTQKELDLFVDPELESMEARLRSEQVPAAMAEIEREILYSESLKCLLAVMSLDPKTITLSLRGLVPMDR
ncbi:MAG: hypothetical protein IPK67_03925 [Planctomycetes bacterium]|nr:hypothetical protein [Planctomycetota bacterium]